MKNSYFIKCLFFLLLMPATLLAQNKKVVMGTVHTATDIAVAGATITAFDTKTNKTVGNTITNNNGEFSIAIPGTEAYLYITHIGFITYKVNTLTEDALNIMLKPQEQQLNEVVIKSQKPFIEQQFDRLVVNVDGSSKAGMNAADILKKIPGVVIINNSEIILEGKGVTINIDGRPTRLTGTDLMNLLNNTQPASISRIEVLYNPSAKLDAQGGGGIINIKTLKRTKPGYDGYMSMTAGHGWKYFSNNDISTGLNYRGGNNYLFGTYSYGFGKQSQEIQRNTYLDNIGQRLLDSTSYTTPNHGQDVRFGWDHYLNKTDVIGILITAYDNDSDNQTTTQTGIYQLNATAKDSSRLSDANNSRNSKGINFNLNYKIALDSARRQEISMDADAGDFNYASDNQLDLASFNKHGQPLFAAQQLFQSGKTRSHIYSYKTDYTQKLYKGILEAGLKGSYVDLNNSFQSQSGLAGGSLHDNGSNDFLYKETIVAGYISSKQTFGKLTIQTGLRGEQTYTNGNSVTLDSVVKRSYFDLFPNLMLGYKLKNSSLSLSYSRRIGRPSYNYLNPFRIVQSAYAVNQGNPYLLPSFTDNYRLGYNLNGKFSVSTSYSRVKNVITDLKLIDDASKVTTSIKANLSRYSYSGLEFGYYDKLFNILDVSYSGGVSFSRYQFIYSQLPVQVQQLTGYVSLNNRVNLPKTCWVEIYFYGQSKVTYGNQVNLPFSNTAISGGKQILKGKGNISLSINDVFFNSITRSEADYANVRYDLKSKYDSRNVRLKVSYNFGNSKVDVRKRSSGSADEQRRNQ